MQPPPPSPIFVTELKIWIREREDLMYLAWVTGLQRLHATRAWGWGLVLPRRTGAAPWAGGAIPDGHTTAGHSGPSHAGPTWSEQKVPNFWIWISSCLLQSPLGRRWLKYVHILMLKAILCNYRIFIMSLILIYTERALILPATVQSRWDGLNCAFLPRFICCGPNPQYLRMWLYLEIEDLYKGN